MAIKSTERTALTRILNNRFDLLEQDVEQRRSEIARLVRQRLQAEAREAMREAEEGLQPFIAEAEDLERRVREYIRQVRAEKSVAPGSVYERREEQVRYVANRKRVSYRLRFREHVNETPVKVEVDDSWTTVGLDERIDEAIVRLQNEAGAGRLNLRRMRQDLEEQILLGQIESEEGRTLLGTIPEVDSVLPAPEEVAKALQSGETLG